MATPNARERKTAALRAKIADTQEQRLAIAKTICGKARRYALWRLVDETKQLPDKIIYCADYGDGRGWTPPCPNDTERLPGSNLFRWRHCFNFIADADRPYKPKTAEQLAGAREKREAKKMKQIRRREARKKRQLQLF